MIALLRSGLFGALTGSALVEVALLCAIVVLSAVLMAVRSHRSASARLRKAGASGYFDHDAAHYGPKGVNSSSGSDDASSVGSSPKATFRTTQPTAPSFTSPKQEHKLRHPPGAAPSGPSSRSSSTTRVPAAVAKPEAVLRAPAPVELAPPPPPTLVKAPVSEPVASTVLAPLPVLKPKGSLPDTLPAMPPPPPPPAEPAEPA